MAERYLIGETALPTEVAVPESLKKKVERNAKLLSEKTAALAAIKKNNKEVRKGLLKRATKYDKEYKLHEKKLIALRRQAKATGNYFVEPEAKVMFVVRITGINKMAPKPRKILKLLRLDQLHKGVFIKCTVPMMNMLKCVQPFVMCGYPNLKTTKMLLLKRGYGKVVQGNGKFRVPLQDNQTISAALGKYGIHGMDDLIHEIYTCGPHFKQANNFLWAFKLSSPNGGYVLKKHGFHEPKGGDWGNREELLNEILRRMI
jgi:large subunit ribosomal protein L7e